MSRVKRYRERRRRKYIRATIIMTLIMTSTILVVLSLNYFKVGDWSEIIVPSKDNLNKGDDSKGTLDEGANIEKGEQGSHIIGENESFGEVSFLFTGDIMFADNVEKLLTHHGFDYPFQDLIPYLTRPDFTLGNLETAVTTHTEAEEKTFTFKSKPEALLSLREAGFDILQLANNHVLDFGQTGLIDTLIYLEKYGLKGTGAGRDEKEAYAPIIEEKNGVKIAFFSFTRVVPDVKWKAGQNYAGVAMIYDPTKAVEAIEEVRDLVDIVVVQVHWGIELMEEKEAYQQDLAYRFVDAGADLVIGTHPHVIQEIEFYKGKLIAYSLGNFVFTTSESPLTWKTLMLEVTCAPSEIRNVKIYPLHNKWAKPTLMDSFESEQFINRLQELSTTVNILEEGVIIPKHDFSNR